MSFDIRLVLGLLSNFSAPAATQTSAPEALDDSAKLIQLLLGNAGAASNNEVAATDNALGTNLAAAVPTAQEQGSIQQPVYERLNKGLLYCTGVLKTYVDKAAYGADSKKALIECIANIQAGVGLEKSINLLSEQDKKHLADTIASHKIEGPEILNDYVSPQYKKYTDSSYADCALKNVEVAEKLGYSKTEGAAKNYGSHYTAASDVKVS